MADVMARFEPVGNHMRLTLSFTGGAASGSYRLTRSDDLLVNATLTYVSTDYEGGILIGDPDDIFKPGSVIINETRDNYYLRYNINSEITLVSAEKPQRAKICAIFAGSVTQSVSFPATPASGRTSNFVAAALRSR